MLRNACYCTVAWAPPSLKTALTALTASPETAELLSTAAALLPFAAGCQSALGIAIPDPFFQSRDSGLRKF